MLCPRSALLALSLIWLIPVCSQAQSPQAAGDATPLPMLAQTEPAPAAPATPPAPAPEPAPPGQATPAPPPESAAPPAASAEAFGEEVTLSPKTIIYMNGNATWDSAFETLIDAFKQLNTYLDRQGLKAAGPAMTIYTSTDDTGFSFQAAVPLAEEPANPPHGDLAVGKSPGGPALKFVHHGSYDSMDSTYEAITNYLDEKRLEAKDLFVEEYATDPVTTPEDQLVITVYVPVK
jgi:effector-binding domain-containing protein